MTPTEELSQLREQHAALKVECARLVTALEMCRDLDVPGHDYAADTKTAHEVAVAALAGHKTTMQQRWEWQGAAIQNYKQQADSLDTTIAEFLFHAKIVGIPEDLVKLLQNGRENAHLRLEAAIAQTITERAEKAAWRAALNADLAIAMAEDRRRREQELDALNEPNEPNEPDEE